MRSGATRWFPGLESKQNYLYTAFPAVPDPATGTLEFPGLFCNGGANWIGFAAFVERVPDMSLYLDLVDEAMEYGQPSCYEACPPLLGAATAEEWLRPPESEPVKWEDLDPAARTLDMREIPQEFRDQLVLVGAHPVLAGRIPDEVGVVGFSCALGQGIGFSTQLESQPLLLSLSTCRFSPTVVSYTGADGIPQQIGTFDVTKAMELDGAQITIDWSVDGTATLTARHLQDGEAERLTGMTSQQLEQLRQPHTGNG